MNPRIYPLQVLADFRIVAEVSVVEAGADADMYAYTHDWTMRKEQAWQMSWQAVNRIPQTLDHNPFTLTQGRHCKVSTL